MTLEPKDIEFDLFDLALFSKAVSYMLENNEDLEGNDLEAYEYLADKTLEVIMNTALKQRRQKKNGEA